MYLKRTSGFFVVRVHLALVLVHEGVGFGEDGVDAAEGRDLDGAADGDADVLAGVGGAQLFEHSCILVCKI